MATIKVNGLTLTHKGSGGMSIATIPDVCKTPSPGGPIPIPYPNIAKSSDLVKGTKTVKVDGRKMAAVKGSEFSMSTGDEAGTAGGVSSSTFKKETSWILYSFDVKLDGKNACRLTDKKFHNHKNTVNLGGEFESPITPGAPRPGDRPEVCPKGGDHDWKETSSKTPEEGRKENEALAGSVKDKSAARGYAFEPKAVDANMKKMDIQKVGAMYKCQKCGQDQEVDVVGKDQIAEAKSRNAKQVKKKGAQARRLRDIQQKLFSKDKNPRAKLDESLDDVNDSRDKYLERGFDVETVP